MSHYLQHVTRGDINKIEHVTFEIFNDNFNYKLVLADKNITAAIDGVYHEFTAAVLNYEPPDRDTQARVITSRLTIPFFEDSVIQDILGLRGSNKPVYCVERIYLDDDLSAPALAERTHVVRNPVLKLIGAITLNLEYSTVGDNNLTEETVNQDDYQSLPL